MPRQSKSSDNTQAGNKRLRKLYLDTLTPARRELEKLDTLERDIRKEYKDGEIPESHYQFMLDNIAERRLLTGIALDKHEAKVKTLTEEYVDINREYIDMFLRGESIADKLLKML